MLAVMVLVSGGGAVRGDAVNPSLDARYSAIQAEYAPRTAPPPLSRSPQGV